MPVASSGPEYDLLGYLDALPGQPLSHRPQESSAELPAGMASAFVQLAYPWVRTAGSADLPQGLAAPDGLLAGLLARSGLERSAFRSSAGLPVMDVHQLRPALRREQIDTLGQRVSLFVQTPGGFQLFSDVTTSLQSAYRQAPVNRLMAILVAAARRVGEDLLFENSGERLWGQVRDQLRWLLDGFRSAGALRGASAEQAYSVRCDRSTMTQNDIDNGRVIAHVRIDPAATVEAITVVLALDEGGGASLSMQR
ncbi:MAG: hypothetical protein HC802_07665 [Caldilineaceae bacterium]|nr:hypothetical protein [Caldilineaceae bacterium]